MKHTRDYVFTKVSNNYPEETNTKVKFKSKLYLIINATEESIVLSMYELYLSRSHQLYRPGSKKSSLKFYKIIGAIIFLYGAG